MSHHSVGWVGVEELQIADLLTRYEMRAAASLTAHAYYNHASVWVAPACGAARALVNARPVAPPPSCS